MESASPQLAAFELHLRELDLPDSPADTADFSRPPQRTAAQDPDHGEDLDQLLLDSAALTEGFLRLAPVPECRLIPLFDASSWPIPIPIPDADDAPLAAAVDAEPDSSSWHIEESRPAVVAVIPRHEHLRTAIAAAITLPLILSATPAFAGAPEVQRPQTVAPQPQAQPTNPTNQPTNQPANQPANQPPTEPAQPPVVEAPPLEPVPAPAPEPPPEPIVAPPPAAGDFDVAATPPGQGVPETLWQAMKGEEVKLMLPSGSRRGRLTAVDGPEVVFVDHDSGGRIYSIPKVQVMELRGVVVSNGMISGTGRPYGVPDPTLPSGGGLIAGGVVATSIGAPFLLTAAVFGGLFGSASVALPFLIPAVLGLGSGIPMLIYGKRRRKAWNESKIQTARLTPSFGGNRHGGWTGSLTLRF